MKFEITRWKIVPSYSGPDPAEFVLGSRHSPVPSARPTKFRTVFGAWLGRRLTLMSPKVV